MYNVYHLSYSSIQDNHYLVLSQLSRLQIREEKVDAKSYTDRCGGG